MKTPSTVLIILDEKVLACPFLGEAMVFVDPKKKFDVRNIERNLKEGVITEEELKEYLESLPDVSHKIYRPEGEEGCQDRSR